MGFWDANRQVQQGIFAGESGGDYNALFGYSNRPGGRFAGTDLTRMSVGDVINFTSPNAPYAEYVRGQVGRTATPVGAYQVVGTTLRDAVQSLGIDPSQPFDQATQDRIGQWVMENQGTGAWEGYRGPPNQISTSGGGAMPTNYPTEQQPRGLLEQFGIQRRGEGGPQGDLPFYQRDRFRDTMGRAATALNSLRMNPDPNIPAAMGDARQRRAGTRTSAWLAQQPGGGEFSAMIEAGADPAQVLMAYRQAQQPVAPDQTAAMQNYQFLVGQGVPEAEARDRAFSGGGTTVNVGGEATTPGWEAVDKAYAETYLRDTTSGIGDAQAQAAQIGTVISALESGDTALTGIAPAALGDLGRALIMPDAQDAKDRVEQVVQRSLRETLGAQFTAVEGERLIARAYNIALSPAQNAARLRVLYEQLAATAQQKVAMREYFAQNGTLRGFDGSIALPSADDFIAAMDQAVPAPQATGVSAPQAAIDYLRSNPNMAADFDAKYGAGAAARVLGGQ